MATADERNRGRMNEVDHYVIQRNMEYLCQQIRGDTIITNMFSKCIFDTDDMDIIEKQMKKSPRQGIKAALKLLMGSGGVNAFNAFIDCLNMSGFAHVAEKLQLGRKERTEAMNVEADERNRGRMNEVDHYVIQCNMEYLCQQIRGDVIITNMFSKCIFDTDDMDIIERQRGEGPRQGIKAALKLLMGSGGVNAFNAFIDCLNMSGFAHVAEKLQLGRKERTEAMNVEARLPDPESAPL